MEEMINRLAVRYAKGNILEDEAGFENYVFEKSTYFWVVYQMLKVYVFYKRNIGAYKDDRDSLLKSCCVLMDRITGTVSVEEKWDYLMLARDFFAARFSNAEIHKLL